MLGIVICSSVACRHVFRCHCVHILKNLLASDSKQYSLHYLLWSFNSLLFCCFHLAEHNLTGHLVNFTIYNSTDLISLLFPESLCTMAQCMAHFFCDNDQYVFWEELIWCPLETFRISGEASGNHPVRQVPNSNGSSQLCWELVDFAGRCLFTNSDARARWAAVGITRRRRDEKEGIRLVDHSHQEWVEIWENLFRIGKIQGHFPHESQ